MESVGTRSRGRGRKRIRKHVLDGQVKRQAVETRSKALVGRYVKKEFRGTGIFLGKIMHYNIGLYRVDYEDGDCEDLESGEVKKFLVEDRDFDDDLVARKRKLDEFLLKKDVEVQEIRAVNVVDSANSVDGDKESLLSELSNSGTTGTDLVQLDGDADSSSDSCEYAQYHDFGSEIEASQIPAPQLPPSSGNIGVPEEFVPYLFSVYGFLRSFSIRLFLSPFGLDDFVGSLNFPGPNTLLDAIHVALMNSLRRHLDSLSTDGSELASKCLRCIDWSLLDALTWPVYVVRYLIVMGYTKGIEWKGFYIDVLEKDYYALSVGKKLLILEILCDDVLESAELRAEIDMREESEVGVDLDGVTVGALGALSSAPRRVHPRYSKTSACKEQEAMEIIMESHETKSSCNSSSLGFKVGESDADADVDQDSNVDECRLCGMDGTLLCCDGCPSAYHSRCISVSKMSIPEGAWYCPECTINKIGPPITKGTLLRGAEVFGIDLYEQVFLGTCNHLLVVKSSINSEPCPRYYNHNDIPKVLQALCSSMELIGLYSGICNRILQYWKISENILSLPGMVEMGVTSTSKKEDGANSSPSCGLSVNEENKIHIVEGENFASCITIGSTENVAGPCLEYYYKNSGLSNTSLDMTTQTSHPSCLRNSDSRKQVFPLTDTKFLEQTKVESSITASAITQPAGPYYLMQQSLSDKSSTTEVATCALGNRNPYCGGHRNGGCIAANISLQHQEGDQVSGRGNRNLEHDCLYMGLLFKPQTYLNYYVHGDFAASAAANLAILSSEENKVSGSHASNNPRKMMSASISLQVKAFSSAAARFFWPNPEKKLVEVPRERCGWCLSCKAAVTSKRGCLLNAAASNATKGAMKILAGLRPVKSGEGSLPSIAMYIMFLEESLRGLVTGPFLNANYRRQWRQQMEQATTCYAIKTLLLELEENIRIIALSGDWVKPVDDWSVESYLTQSSVCPLGSTQKRGPGGRRSRKQSSTSEVTTDDFNDNLSDFIWWRGGMLSRHVFQKGVLPRHLVKKAARQGGSSKVPGIYYVESSEVPKRTRQFVWRAAVEMSKNASQLGLQVRYLDLHVRWSDLVRPEQSLQDGKGPETEASAFRNAFICDKKEIENKIRYGIAFGSQKHLPSRVMKSIIEVEQTQDGMEKYWFSEMRIPLYLIKEYEENVEKTSLPLAGKPMNSLSRLQRRHLKASRMDIFSYLLRKRDNLDKCSCTSCQMDVLLRNAVKCSACQAYCHEQCTMSSTVPVNDEVEFLITCKHCYHTKTFIQIQNHNESPTSPLPFRRQEFQSPVTIPRAVRQKVNSQPFTSVGTVENSSDMKPISHDSSLAMKSRRKLCSWGLIWRKKSAADTGTDFRLKHILLKDNPNMIGSRPVCHLCQKPYNPALMYIHCETCENWYHAEAVELEESKLLDLVGFKCCRCRRIRSPECPYLDLEGKKSLETRKLRRKAPKQGIPEMGLQTGTVSERPTMREPYTPVLPKKEELCLDTRTISEQSKMGEPFKPVLPKTEELCINTQTVLGQHKEGEFCKPASAIKEEIGYVHDGNTFVFSLSGVEQLQESHSQADFEWNTSTASGPGPQKLPVRRHVKHESDANNFSANNPSHTKLSASLETDDHANPGEESLSPCVDWDVSANGYEDGMMFNCETLDYEGMEFEPQTYFTVTELLASDDGEQIDGLDLSGDVMGNWENSSMLQQDGMVQQYGMGTSNNELGHKISFEAVGVTKPCGKCFLTEPSPDLSCQTCGLWIHSHCSPWHEQSPQLGSWKCGGCREWR